MSIRRVLPILAVLLAGCAAGESPPPAAVAPEAAPVVEEEPLPPEPVPDPEPTLQERWAAPFGVVSSGRPAPRPERSAVVTPPAAPAASTPRDATTAPASAAAASPGASPARVPAAPAAPARATDAVRTHRVEWGETWYGIARRYGLAPAALGAANPDVDPERLRAGVVLRIPAGDPRAARERRTHTVGPGDSLWGIARRYGVTVEQIRKANRLQDERVRLGETLVIPAPEEGGR